MGMPGGTELLIIFGIVVLLFGAKKIPELAKGFGKGIKNFKAEMKEVDEEVASTTTEAPKKVEQSEETASVETPKTTTQAQILKQRVSALLREQFGREVVLEKPKDRSFGHFATPIAFSLAKELRKSPMVIAEELASSFNESDIFSSVESVKGYLNFRLSENFLSEYAAWALDNPDSFGKQENKDKILLEFVSANPTGQLHIGHAIGAVY